MFDVIISLTSFPDRFNQFNEFKQSLESLTNQKTNYKFKIVLSIYKDDISKLSEQLLKYCYNKSIEILPCFEDLKGHKKYFYVMQKYNNIPIITVDDDIIFYDNLVDSLYSKYLENKNIIYGGWIRQLIIDKNGHIYPSNIKPYVITDKPSFNYDFGSGSGTLFPPYFITDFDNLLKLIKNQLLINHDEIVLKKLSLDKKLMLQQVFNTKYKLNNKTENQFVKYFNMRLATKNSLSNKNSIKINKKINNYNCDNINQLLEQLLLSKYIFLDNNVLI